MALLIWKFCQASQKCTLIFFKILMLSSQLSWLPRVTAVAIATKTGELNSPSSTVQPVPVGPVIHIGVPSGPLSMIQVTEVQNNQPVVLSNSADDLLIHCRAPYPIEWRTSSHVFQKSTEIYQIVAARDQGDAMEFLEKLRFPVEQPELPDVQNENQTNLEKNDNQTRAEENPASLGIFHPNEFYYHLLITIVPAQGLFGYIGSCQSIPENVSKNGASDGLDKSVLTSRLDFFSPEENRDPASKCFVGAGRRFKIINRSKTPLKILSGNTADSEFLVPCPLILMSTEQQEQFLTSLVQISNEGEADKKETVIPGNYDPKAGFYLSRGEKLEGTFQCRCSPASTTTTATTAQEERVTFDFINNQAHHQNPDKEDWLEITAGTLDFETLKNEETASKIKIRRDGNETECSADSNENPASDSINSAEFIQIACNSRVECDLHRACPTKLCHQNITEGNCTGNICRISQDSSKSGLLKCTLGGSQVFSYYFTGLDENQYDINATDQNHIPPSALIEVRKGGIPNEKTLYSDELHTFVCTASKFLFTPELIVIAKFKNGTTAYFPDESVVYRSDLLSDKLEIKVQVNLSLDMTDVECLAPRSNSSGWMTVNQSLTVKDPRPKIKPGNDGFNQTFNLGDKPHLLCKAEGRPTLTYKWTYENGTEVGDEFGFRYLTTSGELGFRFPELTQDHQGVYVCEASNKAGTQHQKFHVTVKLKDSMPDSILSLSEIIGIVAGIVVLIIMAFGFILYKYYQTRKQLRNLTADEIDEFEKGDPKALKNAEAGGENAHLLPFNKEKFEVSQSDYSLDHNKILGSGEFGVVYSGKLRGVDVAIKTTKSSADVDFFKAFLKEIKVMTVIGEHTNVVQLLGTSTSQIRERIVFVLVELGVNGALNSFLMKNKSNFVNTLSASQLFDVVPEQLVSMGYANVESTIRITTMDLAKWCAQVAAGMAHLASKKIIHGDLAPRNVLLFDDYTAKVTDFGLSRQLYSDVYSKKGKSPLPWRIMAPEALKFLQFSVKSDVWSFGVLAWEIFSLGAVPYSGLSWTHDFVDQLEEGLRLQKPNPVSQEIYQNMCACWHPEPENRPDFGQIEQFYNDIIRENVPATVYTTMD